MDSFFFKKWAIPGLLYRLFSVFLNKHYNFYNTCEKCPSSIRYQDSNPRPLGRESPPITTRPGLPPRSGQSYKTLYDRKLQVKYNSIVRNSNWEQMNDGDAKRHYNLKYLFRNVIRLCLLHHIIGTDLVAAQKLKQLKYSSTSLAAPNLLPKAETTVFPWEELVTWFYMRPKSMLVPFNQRSLGADEAGDQAQIISIKFSLFSTQNDDFRHTK